MQALLDYTIFDLRALDIIIAVAIIALSILLKNILSRTILVSVKKFTQKTQNTLDDKLVNILENPIKIGTVMLGFYIAKEWLRIERFAGIIDSLFSSIATFVVFLILYRLIGEFSVVINKFSATLGKDLRADIENFIIKTLKIIIIIIGSMSILQQWGINISAFLASLGLVGMAFALAAKDTAANLFGSLVIFTDNPFKIGEWIETPNVEGTVEDIGIRSTKVRTFAQASVNVPNALIANTAITNWTRMGKRRIKMSIGLTYATTQEQMEQILTELRAMLGSHADIHPETIMVYFDAFADSSLNLFCYFFTNTTVWAEYLAVREKINLEIMKIVEKNGASFAFPSRSLYIENSAADTQQIL